MVGVVATATLYEWDWIRNSGGIWLATIVSVAILLFGASKLISFQRSAARMRYLADHDALTGLPNRMLFEDRLTHALADARRNKTQCALILWISITSRSSTTPTGMPSGIASCVRLP